jgi:hypothetical protein
VSGRGQLRTLERVIEAPGSDDIDVKRAPREGYRTKNALERTAVNCCERLVVTRYAFGKNVSLRRQSSAGNLAGKIRGRLRNAANLLRKFLELDSSPGHQNFLISQYNRSLFLSLSSHSGTRICARTIEDSRLDALPNFWTIDAPNSSPSPASRLRIVR